MKRSDSLAFLGGFHAFAGGQLDPSDAEVTVENSPNIETSAMVCGAARELFEELGVLVARGCDALTKGQRASLLDDLQSGRMSWPQLLQHYELKLDATDFTFVGRWVTPPSALDGSIRVFSWLIVQANKNQTSSPPSIRAASGFLRKKQLRSGCDPK